MPPAAARGRTAALPRTAAAAGRSAAAAPASPSRSSRRSIDTATADAAAEVEAAEGDTARKEAALLRAAAAASVRQSAPPAKAPEISNEGGDSAVANNRISLPSERLVHNANAKALEVAARAADDAVREKERIQGELDKMKARLRAGQQGSGGRKPPTKPRLSNTARRTKKVLLSNYWLRKNT